MAHSDLTLTYFDIKGLAEVPRIILAYGKKEYKDVRIKVADWDSFKPKTTLGQVPLLDIDGETFPESKAIWNFLAREFGLYPKNIRDQLVVDVVSAVHADASNAQATWFYLDNGPEKTKKKELAIQNTAKYLIYLEDLLKKNGSTGYVVGDSLSLGDVVIFDLLTGYARLSLDYSAEKFPLLAKTVQHVLNVDTIGAYVAQRPDTET